MKPLKERELAAAAKSFRKKVGATRAQAARDMGVSQTSIFHAEESPEQGLTKLRVRMIEKYSKFKMLGPVFFLVTVKSPAIGHIKPMC
jgi:DNA-binding XRE family transcriptional regulator